MELLQDWGTGLEIALYEDAITHLFGGHEHVEAEIGVTIQGRRIGFQRVRCVAPNVAVKITSLANRAERFEDHARRLLAHLDLRAILWINLSIPRVTFTTLER